MGPRPCPQCSAGTLREVDRRYGQRGYRDAKVLIRRIGGEVAQEACKRRTVAGGKHIPCAAG